MSHILQPVKKFLSILVTSQISRASILFFTLVLLLLLWFCYYYGCLRKHSNFSWRYFLFYQRISQTTAVSFRKDSIWSKNFQKTLDKICMAYISISIFYYFNQDQIKLKLKKNLPHVCFLLCNLLCFRSSDDGADYQFNPDNSKCPLVQVQPYYQGHVTKRSRRKPS